MTTAKRRAVQKYAKALHGAGVQFDVAVLLIAMWLQRRKVPATHDNLQIAFAPFQD